MWHSPSQTYDGLLIYDSCGANVVSNFPLRWQGCFLSCIPNTQKLLIILSTWTAFSNSSPSWHSDVMYTSLGQWGMVYQCINSYTKSYASYGSHNTHVPRHWERPGPMKTWFVYITIWGREKHGNQCVQNVICAVKWIQQNKRGVRTLLRVREWPLLQPKNS